LLRRIFVIILVIISSFGCTSTKGQNPGVYKYSPSWNENIAGIEIMNSEIHSTLKLDEQIIFTKITINNTSDKSLGNLAVDAIYPQSWPKSSIKSDFLTIPILASGEHYTFTFMHVHKIQTNDAAIPTVDLLLVSMKIMYTTDLGENIEKVLTQKK